MLYVDGAVFFGPQARLPLDASLAAVTAMLDKAGVDRGVLASLVGLDYDADEGNALTLAACQESRDRFLPLAVLHPFHPYLSPGQVGHNLRRAGFRAVGFFPARQSWPVEALPFIKLAESVSAAGLAIFLTVGGVGEPTRAGKALAGVQGPVVIRSEAPAGYLLTAEYLALGREYGNLHFDVGNLVGSGAIETLVEALGAERLVWGSNTPFAYPGGPLALVSSAAITESDRAWLAHRTILRLLGEA